MYTKEQLEICLNIFGKQLVNPLKYFKLINILFLYHFFWAFAYTTLEMLFQTNLMKEGELLSVKKCFRNLLFANLLLLMTFIFFPVLIFHPHLEIWQLGLDYLNKD